MKKIMFNDKYGLTEAVLSGRKTQTRRVAPNNTPLGNWSETAKKSRYQVGEVVAVAQAYREVAHPNDGFLDDRYEVKDEYAAGWSNKIFVRADLMPHRIRITNVRAERLQDISESDCRAEGIISNIDPMTNLTHYMFPNWGGDYISNRAAYAALIDRISGKGTWESNPYVFVYDFELVD